jgi:hypothetical protein
MKVIGGNPWIERTETSDKVQLKPTSLLHKAKSNTGRNLSTRFGGRIRGKDNAHNHRRSRGSIRLTQTCFSETEGFFQLLEP